MIKVVFFDAAGTLFDARVPIAESYARIAGRYGVERNAEAVNEGFRRAFHQAPPLAFGPGREAAELRALEHRWWREVVAQTFLDTAIFSDFQGYFDELFAFFGEPDNWRVDPGAIPMLQRLRGDGLRLGIISNFDYRLYRILDGLGLRPYFDSITISSEAGYAKPAPEVFHVALAKHGATPLEALHVGDSPHHDGAGARAANIACVLIDPGAAARRASDPHDLAITSLDEIPDLVRRFRT
ncbi:MAG TPA: HAD-IA family hydrolase [Candidatus Binataceae bacterium]|nr:HAD-IA family hydrolase [Candidatus Binataceae bacterium]